MYFFFLLSQNVVVLIEMTRLSGVVLTDRDKIKMGLFQKLLFHHQSTSNEKFDDPDNDNERYVGFSFFKIQQI